MRRRRAGHVLRRHGVPSGYHKAGIKAKQAGLLASWRSVDASQCDACGSTLVGRDTQTAHPLRCPGSRQALALEILAARRSKP
jgi:hypothetical protein